MSDTSGCTGAICRFCDAPLSFTMVDLGKSPLCQTMLSAEQLNQGEVFYPLHVYVCGECSLVQIEEYISTALLLDIFTLQHDSCQLTTSTGSAKSDDSLTAEIDI